MMALLYGLYYDPEADKYHQKENIKKPRENSNINIGIFNGNCFEAVSAILFCNTLTLGKLSSLSKSKGIDPAYIINVRYDASYPYFKIHEVSADQPENLVDGLYIFHNQNAKNKLSKDIFEASGIVQFYFEENRLEATGFRDPIVARYCDANGHLYKELIKSTAASNYNKTRAWGFL